jgi:hypothetical protein
METPGITTTRWFDAALMPAEQVDQRDNIKAWSCSAMAATPSPACPRPEGPGELSNCWSSPIRIRRPSRSLGERKDGTYLLPICTQFEMRRLAHRVEPLDPVGREGRRADLRVEERLRRHVHAGREARLRRPRCSRTSR